jgi:hypothetical protein
VTHDVGSEIPARNGPAVLAIIPNQARGCSIWNACGDRPADKLRRLGIGCAVGTVASCCWDFDDGHTATTTIPTTTHANATSRNFSAPLTETDSAGTSTTRTYTGQTPINN